MTIKLTKRRGDKHCPFCGKLDAQASEFHYTARVSCMRCCASGPVEAFHKGDETAAISKAVALWNKRVEVGTR